MKYAEKNLQANEIRGKKSASQSESVISQDLEGQNSRKSVKIYCFNAKQSRQKPRTWVIMVAESSQNLLFRA